MSLTFGPQWYVKQTAHLLHFKHSRIGIMHTAMFQLTYRAVIFLQPNIGIFAVHSWQKMQNLQIIHGCSYSKSQIRLSDLKLK